MVPEEVARIIEILDENLLWCEENQEVRDRIAWEIYNSLNLCKCP